MTGPLVFVLFQFCNYIWIRGSQCQGRCISLLQNRVSPQLISHYLLVTLNVLSRCWNSTKCFLNYHKTDWASLPPSPKECRWHFQLRPQHFRVWYPTAEGPPPANTAAAVCRWSPLGPPLPSSVGSHCAAPASGGMRHL